MRGVGMWWIVAVVLMAAVLAAVPAPASAEGEVAYLLVPGVDGGCTDEAHGKWIEVLSCDWGSVPPPRGALAGYGGGGAGKLCFGDFTVLKPVDASSGTLQEWSLAGTVIPEVTIDLAKRARSGFRYLVLRKVRVASVRPVEGEGSESLSEAVTLSFRQVLYR